MLLTKDSLGSWRPYEYDIKPWILLAQLKLEREKMLLDKLGSFKDVFNDNNSLDAIYGLLDSEDPFKLSLWKQYVNTENKKRAITNEIAKGANPTQFSKLILDIKTETKKLLFALAAITVRDNLQADYNSNNSNFIYSEIPEKVGYDRIAQNWTPFKISIKNVLDEAMKAGKAISGSVTNDEFNAYNQYKINQISERGVKYEDLLKMLANGDFDEVLDNIRSRVGYDKIIDEREKDRLDKIIVSAFMNGFSYKTSSKLTSNGTPSRRLGGLGSIKTDPRLGTGHIVSSNSGERKTTTAKESTANKQLKNIIWKGRVAMPNQKGNYTLYEYVGKHLVKVTDNEVINRFKAEHQDIKLEAEGGLIKNKYEDGSQISNPDSVSSSVADNPDLDKTTEYTDEGDELVYLGVDDERKLKDVAESFKTQIPDLTTGTEDIPLKDLIRRCVNNENSFMLKEMNTIGELGNIALEILDNIPTLKGKTDLSKYNEYDYVGIAEYALNNVLSKNITPEFKEKIRTALEEYALMKKNQGKLNESINKICNYIEKNRLFNSDKAYVKDGYYFTKEINNKSPLKRFLNILKYDGAENSLFETLAGKTYTLNTSSIEAIPSGNEDERKSQMESIAQQLDVLDKGKNHLLLQMSKGDRIQPFATFSGDKMIEDDRIYVLPEKFSNVGKTFSATKDFPIWFQRYGLDNTSMWGDFIPNIPKDLIVDNQSLNMNLGEEFDITKSWFGGGHRDAKLNFGNMIRKNTGIQISDEKIKNVLKNKEYLLNPEVFKDRLANYLFFDKENKIKFGFKVQDGKIKFVKAGTDGESFTAGEFADILEKSKLQGRKNGIVKAIAEADQKQKNAIENMYKNIVDTMDRLLDVVAFRYKHLWDLMKLYGELGNAYKRNKYKGITETDINSFFKNVMQKTGSNGRSKWIEKVPNLGQQLLLMTIEIPLQSVGHAAFQKTQDTTQSNKNFKELIENSLIDKDLLLKERILLDNANSLTEGEDVIKPHVKTLEDGTKSMGMAPEDLDKILTSMDNITVTNVDTILYSPEMDKVLCKVVYEKDGKSKKMSVALDPDLIISTNNGLDEAREDAVQLKVERRSIIRAYENLMDLDFKEQIGLFVRTKEKNGKLYLGKDSVAREINETQIDKSTSIIKSILQKYLYPPVEKGNSTKDGDNNEKLE